MPVVEQRARSIIVPTKLPDTDWVVNPYTGCQFGCGYCYASYMGRSVGEPVGRWGDYLYAKINAPDLARAQLSAMDPDRKHGNVLLSSVTDPYQAPEARYRLSRGVLEAFASDGWPGRVAVLTKAPLVTRDVDVLSALPRAEVGMTVTTTDDAIARWLEVRAPSASRRLGALRDLADAGVETFAFVGPLLPHFRERPQQLDALFGALAQAGVGSVFVEHINLSGYIRRRLDGFLEHQPIGVSAAYQRAADEDHRAELDDLVAALVDKHSLHLRLSKVLRHTRPTSSRSGPPRVPHRERRLAR